MKQRSKWFIFALLAVAQFMVVLDVSIVNVALPAIQRALHFNANTLQWVITAYALTFGGFLLLGGRAADLFGRKRMLLIGMTGFTLFSLLIGLSQSAGMLIVLRSLQGLMAACMSPAALSTVLTTFKEGSERNRALGFWTMVATGGAAVGLLLGGVLSQYLSWRWNFFVNVPVGILVALGIWQSVPKHEKEARDNSLDLPGSILVTSGLIAFVYAISEAPMKGWLSAQTIGVGALATVLLAAFIWNEAHSKHPLMPLSTFKVRNVSGANLMMAPIYAGMMGMFFLLSLYIQATLHYKPVITGLSFLPFPILVALMSNRVAKTVSKIGYKRLLVIGPLLTMLGVLWLSRLPVSGHYLTDILPALILMPLGMGMTFMPVIAAATSGVKPNEAGLASGLINTSQQMGGALGLAILTGVASSVTAKSLQLGTLPALVRGYHVAFDVSAAFMLFAIVLAVTVIRQPRNVQHHATASAEATAVH